MSSFYIRDIGRNGNGLVGQIPHVILVLEVILWVLTPFTKPLNHSHMLLPRDEKLMLHKLQMIKNSRWHTPLHGQLPWNLLKMRIPGLSPRGRCVLGIERTSASACCPPEGLISDVPIRPAPAGSPLQRVFGQMTGWKWERLITVEHGGHLHVISSAVAKLPIFLVSAWGSAWGVSIFPCVSTKSPAVWCYHKGKMSACLKSLVKSEVKKWSVALGRGSRKVMTFLDTGVWRGSCQIPLFPSRWLFPLHTALYSDIWKRFLFF